MFSVVSSMETEEAKTVTKEEKLVAFKKAALVAVGRWSDLIEHAKIIGRFH